MQAASKNANRFSFIFSIFLCFSISGKEHFGVVVVVRRRRLSFSLFHLRNRSRVDVGALIIGLFIIVSRVANSITQSVCLNVLAVAAAVSAGAAAWRMMCWI